MEGAKKTENVTGTKENGESKIPKPAKFPSLKETSSKTLEEKKTAQSSKTTTKILLNELNCWWYAPPGETFECEPPV
ncbi:hypothetical protein AVEN_143190-1 [Araneus ventricosus]|uniref:Uncharacterized protein n=1 Tax=Araneus ventricosus TaxID=182803 RepID=A0A4Y2RF90_ARAVE|nr:hypothetical protein AVEN_143190-1 [Araneus ventricosus]